MASQIPNFVTGSWQGLLASGGTPPAVLEKLQSSVQRIVERPDVDKRLQELGSEPSDMNRQQIAEWMRTETQRWGKVVKDNNIKAEWTARQAQRSKGGAGGRRPSARDIRGAACPGGLKRPAYCIPQPIHEEMGGHKSRKFKYSSPT